MLFGIDNDKDTSELNRRISHRILTPRRCAVLILLQIVGIIGAYEILRLVGLDDLKVAIVIGVFAAWTIFNSFIKKERIRQQAIVLYLDGRCENCGFPKNSAREGICPECGMKNDNSDRTPNAGRGK